MSEHDDIARMEALSKWPLKDFIDLSAIPHSQRTPPQQMRLRQAEAALKRKAKSGVPILIKQPAMKAKKAETSSAMIYPITFALVVIAGLIAVITLM